jgi:hypothetical protein
MGGGHGPGLTGWLQKPATSPVTVSHNQPRVVPASPVATPSGVMPKAALRR